jgi:tRNA(Ile)-lysidine synthase
LRQRPPAASFQAGPKRPARSLKKQFQQAGVPLWARSAPLVYLQGRLAYVPGLGFDARWTLVEADAGGLQIEWVPDEP